MRIWRDIPYTDGRYQVSDDGFVRSMPDIDSQGRFLSGRVIRPALTEKGYFKVCLGGVDFRVHRLVAAVFVENAVGGSQINHKNGVKTDNRAENLEWCTNSDNQLHRHRVLGQAGGMSGKRGIACKNSKPLLGVSATDGQTRYFGGASEAGRILGICPSGISMAARGELRAFKGWHWEFISREAFHAAVA